MLPRVLLLVSTTSYRTDEFVAATRALGAEPVVGSDRCHVLAEELTFVDGSLALDFRHAHVAAARIVEAARAQPLDAIVPTDDPTAEIAAPPPRNCSCAATRSTPPSPRATSARCARRSRGRAFPAPNSRCTNKMRRRSTVKFPCVVKPLLCSASRGVIRADDRGVASRGVASLARAVANAGRCARWKIPTATRMLVEAFIARRRGGARGAARRDAVADAGDFRQARSARRAVLRGDDLRHAVAPPRRKAAIAAAAQARRALSALARGRCTRSCGSTARGAGGSWKWRRARSAACARARCASCADVARGAGDRHALGGRAGAGASAGAGGRDDDADPARRACCAASTASRRRAPCPASRTCRSRSAPARCLVPLPEGASYLGFVFARGASPAAVEAALRDAHGLLRFDVAALLT